jgi:hypothetical protein
MHLPVVVIVARKAAAIAEEHLAARHRAGAMVAVIPEVVPAVNRLVEEALRNQADITRDGTIIDF